MGIDWMIRRGIGKKLLLSYAALILFIFLVTTLAFTFIGRKTIESEVRNQLKEEATQIEKIIAKTLKENEETITDNLTVRRNLRAAGTLIQSHLIVTKADAPLKILFTNLSDDERKQTVEVFRLGNLSKENIVYEMPVILNGKTVAQITLFSQMEDFKTLNQLMRRSLLISLFFAGLIACMLAIMLEKKLAKPIKQLEKAISQYVPNKEIQMPTIQSGDEIEQLSNNFKKMIQKIEQYDATQKGMLQNTSHELKTPIMSIQGYAEGILDGVLEGDEAMEALNIIISESKRLKKTIDEVLYLSKIENQHLTLKKSFVGLEDLVTSAMRTVKPLADEKGIIITFEITDPILDDYLMDGEKILRCLINLLGNATRYAKSEVHLILSVDHKLIISVKDDGDGFSEDALKLAFDRFYKGTQGGKGLGLTITKAIIDAHGGQIKLENNPNGGANVTFSLPIREK